MLDPLEAAARARVGGVVRGKWRLERLLGVGGMASVYAATHRNGMRGAVKMLHPELNAILEARERFLREGYAANQVGHPGVARVLDDDVAEDGSVFLVMELLEGQTVDAMAEVHGHRLAAPAVLAIADTVLDVLAKAHDKGIVHRDLKPENVFVTTAGDVRVLDFGIARVRELQGSARATQTGATMGTPAYMPPEQASGQWSLVDGRTDLWALGATMFALLSGRTVHGAPTPQLLMAAAMTTPAPRLASVVQGVPADVAAIVDRALAFDRESRWPDARAMQRAVQAARARLPAVLLTVAPREDPSSPALGPSSTVVSATRTAAPVSTSSVSSGAPRPSAPHGLAVACGAMIAMALGGALAVHLFASPAPSAVLSTASAEVVAPTAEPPAPTAIMVAPSATATADVAPTASAVAPTVSADKPKPVAPRPPVRPSSPAHPSHLPGIY